METAVKCIERTDGLLGTATITIPNSILCSLSFPQESIWTRSSKGAEQEHTTTGISTTITTVQSISITSVNWEQ